MSENQKVEIKADLELLRSKDEKNIRQVVNKLIDKKIPLEDLTVILEEMKLDPEDLSILWVAVILGEKREASAIKPLVKVFEKPTGLLAVAAYDALLLISEKNAKEVYEACRQYLDKFFKDLGDIKEEDKWAMKEQMNKDRVYVYDILGRLQPDKDVSEDIKNYLIELAEKDYVVNGRIVLNLLRWPLEKKMTSFLKRQMEVALISRKGIGKANREYIEAKWALINYEKGAYGEKYPYSRKEETMTWEKRWQPFFDQWNASKKDKPSEDNNKPDEKDTENTKSKSESEDKDAEKKEAERYQKEAKEFNAFVDPKFNIEDYISVRKVSQREKAISKKLDELDLKKEWDLNKIQIKIGRSTDFYQAVNFFITELQLTGDKKKAAEFADVLYELWSITPQEDWNGLSPVEKSIYDKTGHKPGRNEPCPCGAVNADGLPKKYKKCCAKKYSA